MFSIINSKSFDVILLNTSKNIYPMMTNNITQGVCVCVCVCVCKAYE